MSVEEIAVGHVYRTRHGGIWMVTGIGPRYAPAGASSRNWTWVRAELMHGSLAQNGYSRVEEQRWRLNDFIRVVQDELSENEIRDISHIFGFSVSVRKLSVYKHESTGPSEPMQVDLIVEED